jgi:hypothetical protein
VWCAETCCRIHNAWIIHLVHVVLVPQAKQIDVTVVCLFVSFKCSDFTWCIFCYTNYDALHQLNRHNWHVTQCSLWSVFVNNRAKWQINMNSKQTGAKPAGFKNCNSSPVAYPRFFFGEGGFNKFSWGQRRDRTGNWGRQPPSQGFWRQLWFGTINFISYSKIFLIFGTLDYLWWQPIYLSLLM